MPPQANMEAPPPVPPPTPAPAAGTVPTAPPSFDVVRISRNCTAVFAGRAMPGSVVVIKTGTREIRSEEHTSELQSLMRNTYDDFGLKRKNTTYIYKTHNQILTINRITQYNYK